MSDDPFNMSMRKFLKQVGVTSQQAIEEAVRTAREDGTLPDGPLSAKMTLTLDGVDMTHVVNGEIRTGAASAGDGSAPDTDTDSDRDTQT